MTIQQIKEAISRIRTALNRGRLTAAFSEINALALSTSSSWEIRNSIGRLRENFSLIKTFALDGYSDPDRPKMLEDIREGLIGICNMILREALSTDSPEQYFATLRYERLQSDTLSSLIADYDKLLSKFSLSRYGFSMPEKSGGVTRKDIELVENRIFDRVWTTYPLTANDTEAISHLTESDVTPKAMKSLCLNALFLGGQKFYEPSRIELLASIYDKNDDAELQIQSLSQLLMLLWQWRGEQLPHRLSDRIKLMTDNEDTARDIRMIFLQLIRTIDTARITREVNEDIIPKMQNLSPEIKKLSEMQELSADALETNPQWQDLLRKSGLEDQLKRLNDMQMEGADVMMSTFSHLKSFPFFNPVVNWFRPFDSDNDQIASAPRELLEMIARAPFLCDSDKYSMALSLSNLQPGMLDMVRSQLSEHNINLAEAAASGIEARGRREIAANYLQSIYRFFNLYRRKSDFYNPFASTIDLFLVRPLSDALNDKESIEAVADFYLKHGYYPEALDTINRLPGDELFLSNDMLQKTGYCRQKLGDYSGAIEAYSKSELLDGRNKWTLNRLAYCYKAIGDFKSALEYFSRLLELNPDDLKLTLNAAHCHMQLGNLDEALKLYYKVEYLDEDTTSTLRPVAWCTLLMGNLDKSRSYFERVLLDNPGANDYLNYGHMSLASGNPREAVNAYSTALQLMDNDFSRLQKVIEADRKYLKRYEIDNHLIDLVVDEVEAALWK